MRLGTSSDSRTCDDPRLPTRRPGRQGQLVLPGDHGQRGPSSIPLLAADAASAGITGSGPAAASNTVKNTRTTSARPENRRCQPRTVSGGRPAAAAICRNDAPRALAASAAPITHAGCVVAGDFLADPD